LAKLPRIPIGVDIIEIRRIRQAISRWGNSFLKRVYTNNELEYCHNEAMRLAARFAAKEAVMKALGIGTKGIGWKDIEILLNSDGAPRIQLHGQAHKKSKELGITEFSVTLSHSKQYAIAFVIGDVVPQRTLRDKASTIDARNFPDS